MMIRIINLNQLFGVFILMSKKTKKKIQSEIKKAEQKIFSIYQNVLPKYKDKVDINKKGKIDD